MTTNCGVDAGGPGTCHFAIDVQGVEGFCVASAAPDPRCPDGGSSLCSGDAPIECADGFAVCLCSNDAGPSCPR
jgi:hypothetical protein